MQLKYKTYIAEVTFSALTCCFHGEVINLNQSQQHQDALVFLASMQKNLQEALQQTIEQYLCKKELFISHTT